jgi:hypothetical protein
VPACQCGSERRGGGGADGKGGHDQDEVTGDRSVKPYLGLVQPEAVFRVGDRLRGFGQLPAEVKLTNPRHPLAGQRVRVVSAFRRSGDAWLVVMLPDGYPARVRVDDTDLGGLCVAGAGTTVLSVAGIRRLRELAVAVAARGQGR